MDKRKRCGDAAKARSLPAPPPPPLVDTEGENWYLEVELDPQPPFEYRPLPPLLHTMVQEQLKEAVAFYNQHGGGSARQRTRDDEAVVEPMDESICNGY